jgi:hypothetical protein
MKQSVLTQLAEFSALLPYRQFQTAIKSDIILGSPSAGCQGVGICRVMLHDEMILCKCPKQLAWITVGPNRKLRVNFLKSDLSPDQIQQHFSWNLFQVQEPYALPRRITRALGIPPTSIAPGVFPVWETAQWLTVEF